MTSLLILLWRLVVIASRAIFFLLFFFIALLNSQRVDLNWFVDQTVRIPLIFIILGSFLLGMLLAGVAFYRSLNKRVE